MYSRAINYLQKFYEHRDGAQKAYSLTARLLAFGFLQALR